MPPHRAQPLAPLPRHWSEWLLLPLELAGSWMAGSSDRTGERVCAVLGDLVYFLTSRGTVALRNFEHAFPDRSPEWQEAMARRSCRRTVEMFLLVLALPHFPEERLRRLLTIPERYQELLEVAESGPAICLVGHSTLAEGLVILPRLRPDGPPITVAFRPFDLPVLDRWVKRVRQRWGCRLLARRAEVHGMRDAVAAGHWLGILFDQNAGEPGALITFFDRVASASELPGLLARRYHCRVLFITPRRDSFWRGHLEFEELDEPKDVEAITVATNLWLERLLQGDEETCAGWLWMHKRWKTQDFPHRFLRLEQKRNSLDACLRRKGQSALPRRTRFWVRLPNWLGDAVMAAPLLRALRASRPDAHLTVVGSAPLLALYQRLGLAEEVVPLPARGPGYFRHFLRLGRRPPDYQILFTNSARGDLEAWCLGASLRIGLAYPGRWRPLLSHVWRVPRGTDLRTTHQFELWRRFLESFGLPPEIDLSPLAPPPGSVPDRWTKRVGFICGTENSPEKRWPVGHWRALLERLLDSEGRLEVHLFGTVRDRLITQAVGNGFDPARVHPRAGQTSLVDLLREYSLCHLVIGNDTGGLHLANSLGVPVIGLFGPTNPLRTGPVFEAPRRLLQPPGCPPTGGAGMEALRPEAVWESTRGLLGLGPS